MKGYRVVRMLRSNPRYWCKYFAWTNILVLLYTLVSLDSSHNHLLSEEVTEPPRETVRSSDSNSGHSEAGHKFQQFDLTTWQESQTFKLEDSTEEHFITVGDGQCYILGTDLHLSGPGSGCVCRPGYHGHHCGIPASAWHGHYKHHPRAAAKLVPRSRPRRLVHGLQVNHETDLFEARLEMLAGLVDVYLVLESNYTSYGSGKPLTFLDKFREGWMAKFQEKILYVFLPFFPKAGETDGWYADSYLRLYLGTRGMRMVEGGRDDDVFLLLDADELPTREALLFLKLYDGWTEPVKFGFRWSVFGFFWLESREPGLMESLPLLGSLFSKPPAEKLLTLYVACTLGMLRDVYGNNAMSLRRNVLHHSLLAARLANYTASHAAPAEWRLGELGHYAGWHCSWCYEPPGIRLKLQSAQRHDKPRWGDYPDKLELGYIAGLIETGGWFDGGHPFIRVDRAQTPAHLYAPAFFLENEDRFEHLLVPPQHRTRNRTRT